MKIKKILLGVCALLLLWTGVVFAEGEDVKTITGFDIVGKNYRGTHKTIYYKMTLEELVAKVLPASYKVQVEGESESVSVPVEWTCVDDYENVTFGVYTFIPTVADRNYRLSEDLKFYNIPYVELTVDSEIGEPGLTMHVTVQTADGNSYTIKAYKTMDIRHVKQTIYAITGIRVENQQIFYNGEELREGTPLGEKFVQGDISVEVVEVGKEDLSIEQDIDAPKAEEMEENAVNDDMNDSKPVGNLEQSSDEEIQTEINIVKVEDQEQVTSRAVKTGDTRMIIPWIILFVMSVAGIVTMIGVKTRKR